VGGVFSTSQTAGAPVGWCRRILPAGRARGLVANAGNSNVHTGPGGAIATEETAKAAARVLGCPSEEIYVTSTGIIGVPLPYEKITAALPQLGRELRSGGFRAAAEAIRTTDTYAKGATRMADIGGTRVVINGIAKGSGMIAPNMATMHAFVFTDAALPAAVLQALIARAVDESFNCITVDSDTSTSDTVLLFATGQGPAHPAIGDPGDRRLSDFRAKLGEVTRDLAHQIVRDGEGATKFMAITVSGAASRRAARRIALAIANSPLVKTAAAGGDPNWGRIVAAVGKAGERATRDKLRIWIGEQLVAAGGGLGRGAGGALHEEPRDRLRRRCRGRPRPGDSVDVRSRPRLHRHQRRLHLVSAAPGAGAMRLSNRPIVLVAAVALLDRDGRVLLARRPEGKAMAGLWEFPGGKVGPGETPEEAAIRELREEIGVSAEPSCLTPLTFASYAYEDFHLLMPLYACRHWHGFAAAREGQELKWVRPNRLRDYPMPPADIPLIATLQDLF